MLWASSSPKIASAGTPWEIAYARATAASVVRSPDSLPPVTTKCGAMPSFQSLTACSRRASKTGDGRPSYWAAPEDHDRVRRAPFVRGALLPDPGGGEGGGETDGEAGGEDEAHEIPGPGPGQAP